MMNNNVAQEKNFPQTLELTKKKYNIISEFKPNVEDLQ